MVDELPALDDSDEATATLCDSGPDDEWGDWEAQRGNALASAQDRVEPDTDNGEGDDDA